MRLLVSKVSYSYDVLRCMMIDKEPGPMILYNNDFD